MLMLLSVFGGAKYPLVCFLTELLEFFIFWIQVFYQVSFTNCFSYTVFKFLLFINDVFLEKFIHLEWEPACTCSGQRESARENPKQLYANIGDLRPRNYEIIILAKVKNWKLSWLIHTGTPSTVSFEQKLLIPMKLNVSNFVFLLVLLTFHTYPKYPR